MTTKSIKVLAFCGAALFSGSATAQDPALDQQAVEQGIPVTELRVFAEVMERIRSAYIDEVSDQELLESAIRGMLYELDPHSAYLTPDQFDDLQISTSGEFGGLGIEVSMENGFVKVVTPLDDTPASRAGLASGDLILKIDNTFVKGKTLSEAVTLLRGSIGSSVELSVLSEGDDKPRKVKLVRDRIQLQSVRSEILEPGYGYLRVTQFQNNTGHDAQQHLARLQEQGPLNGLVLDLRNNPGGVLNAAVQLADLFLDDGLVVYTQGREAGSRTNFNATPGDILNGTPVIVLVNAGSASASEIVAGALQDQERAILVGQRTFGKGSVQTILPLHGERGLKLTTARYYTPSGRSIQAEGIRPDILTNVARVELNEEQDSLRESDLPGHLENSQDSTAEEDQDPSLAETDYTLYEGLAILKGIHLSQRGSQ